jgi:hypothetical protein
MAKNLRVRSKIWNKLGEGNMNTCQIHDWLNEETVRGISMNKVVNILAKGPEFEKVGQVKVRSVANTYKVIVWSRTNAGHSDRDNTN